MLNRLGLTERMTTTVEETARINQQPIDYEKVDDVLQKQRKIAKALDNGEQDEQQGDSINLDNNRDV